MTNKLRHQENCSKKILQIKIIMQGNYIKIGNNWQQITQPELWASCATEAEYFRILSDRQKKENKPIFFIPDAEPGIIPGEGLI